jgi:tRNA-binding EMAP/Myf-like protein
LLENCNSIKVKRLFLFLAESYQHPWLKKINRAKIDLGQGKRVIVKGGKLDSKYQITVTNETP